MLWLTRLAAALATFATLWLAFEPPGDGPGLIPWDKAGHFLSFYVLTILYVLAAPRAPRISTRRSPPEPTRCSPPRSSTTANTPSAT